MDKERRLRSFRGGKYPEGMENIDDPAPTAAATESPAYV